MIIKQTDDKNHQLDSLQSLLSYPNIDSSTKKRIEREILNIKAGMRGEEEAAYEMRIHWESSKNWMIIHDLRIEHEDIVAQIDHLIINRWLEIWVCESKHFSEGIAINEHAEFAAFFGSKPYGVPSPIEQNNKHILILKRLLNSNVKLPTRLGFTIKPDLKSLVLVSKSARISRPKKKIDGLDVIVKNDQLFKTINKSVEDNNPLSMAKIVGQDTLQELAEKIVEFHRPIKFNWAAKFGLSDALQASSITQQTTFQTVKSNTTETPKPTHREVKSKSTDEPHSPKQKLECHSCGSPVGYNVAKFCWFNKPKFGGKIYCMDCQRKI
jgi:hypothetical protein